MAIYLTNPNEIAHFVHTNNLNICPPVSIVSDHWNMGLQSSRYYSEISSLCLGLDLRIMDKLKFKPIPRYDFLEPPRIAWLDPNSLIPHEPTSPEHLKSLITYLKNLDNDTLLPTIIVTRSTPHVILDGHHRWQSSIALNISRVPCWVVDDLRVDASSDTLLPVPHTQFLNASSLYTHATSRSYVPSTKYAYYRVRVYDTRIKAVLRIHDIANKARSAAFSNSPAKSGFGVKGTKHVAIRVPTLTSAPVLPFITGSHDPKMPGSVSSNPNLASFSSAHDADDDQEVRLEKVAPLIEWGLWKSAGVGYRPKYLHGIDVALLRPISDLGEAGVSLAPPTCSGALSNQS